MLRILNLTLNKSSQRVDRRKWHQFHSVQSMVTPGARKLQSWVLMTVSVAVLGFFDCWDGWLIISLSLSLSEKLLSRVAFNFRVSSFNPSPERCSRAPLVTCHCIEGVIASITCRLTRRFSPKHQLQKWQPSQLPHAWILVSSLQRPPLLMCRCLRPAMSRQPLRLVFAYSFHKWTWDLKISESVGGVASD